MIIAVDFDGTLVDHVFPEIGQPVPGAFKWLKQFQGAGAKLILWTMRCDEEDSFVDAHYLQKAIEFCGEQGVEFWAVNCNPEQSTWSTSPKAYAHIYIDDASFGCPLAPSPREGGRPVADWSRIGPEVLSLIERRGSHE